jgi:hypothetical protein
MRIGKATATTAAVVLTAGLIFLSTRADAGPGPMMRLAAAESGDGGGSAINLTVRQLIVQPIRAYVGDVVRIEMWVDNREDGSQSSNAEVFANKKRVGRQLFRWGGGSPGAGERLYKLYFDWDTKGWAPGEYKIKAEVFVFEDTSPFDNELTAKQTVILAAPGGGFPGGETAGGSYTEIDPRYK